jgi:putative transcriptional regulator
MLARVRTSRGNEVPHSGALRVVLRGIVSFSSMKAISGVLLLCLTGSLAGLAGRGATKPPTQPVYLVARRGLMDPNFRHTVVLMVPVKGFPGVLGIIVNRPTPILTKDLFNYPQLMSNTAHAYFGGPVDIRDVSVIYRSSHPPDHAIPLSPGVYASFDAPAVEALLAEKLRDQDRRIYLGRAQWGHAQLRREMLEGSWYSIRAPSAVIFSAEDSDQVWRDVLDRARPGMLATNYRLILRRLSRAGATLVSPEDQRPSLYSR